MSISYQLAITNPDIKTLGYIIAVASLNDKHDRSTPSHYHWKILKCRMIIFSSSSIIACPDKKDVKQVHIVFNKIGDDYDKLNSLLLKFSLTQEGTIQDVTPEILSVCFEYTLTAKLAPLWNTLGFTYLINNRDFFITKGLQDGVKFNISSKDNTTLINVQPVKINLMISDEIFLPGETVRVLPSLNKAVVEEYSKTLPENAVFKSYKDLRRHWKNIHGYRIPEQECSFYLIRFWRGEPLSYPSICVLRSFPIITPMSKTAGDTVMSKFLKCLKNKMTHMLGKPLNIHCSTLTADGDSDYRGCSESQAVSLCTPTQRYNYK